MNLPELNIGKAFARAAIDTHADHARTMARRYGIGNPRVTMAAAYTIELIRAFRAKYVEV